jgi:hypothetical protein
MENSLPIVGHEFFYSMTLYMKRRDNLALNNRMLPFGKLEKDWGKGVVNQSELI